MSEVINEAPISNPSSSDSNTNTTPKTKISAPSLATDTQRKNDQTNAYLAELAIRPQTIRNKLAAAFGQSTAAPNTTALIALRTKKPFKKQREYVRRNPLMSIRPPRKSVKTQKSISDTNATDIDDVNYSYIERVIRVNPSYTRNPFPHKSSKKKVSMVIPVYPPDFPYLTQLLTKLKFQSVWPDEIIIAASQTERVPVHETELNVTVVMIDAPQTAGINRNMGMKYASGDVIMFADADDEYHPQKVEVTLTLMEKYACDLFLHSYLFMEHQRGQKNGPGGNSNNNKRPTGFFDPIDMRTLRFNFTNDLFERTFPGGSRSRAEEIRKVKRRKTNLEAPFPIHHGVSTIRGELRNQYRFTGLTRAQDGIFCRDILWDRRMVCITDAPLMLYAVDNVPGT